MFRVMQASVKSWGWKWYDFSEKKNMVAWKQHLLLHAYSTVIKHVFCNICELIQEPLFHLWYSSHPFSKAILFHHPWWLDRPQLTGFILSEPLFANEFARYFSITFIDLKSCILCKVGNFALLIVNAFLCIILQCSNLHERKDIAALLNTCGLWVEIKIEIHLQFTKSSDFLSF